ncbi:MAG TPA: patatin-like phospholipase family protein [Terriglobales bacterium]|nr:patatin-like phospholipase family protein [Terriglobales bacterium]
MCGSWQVFGVLFLSVSVSLAQDRPVSHAAPAPAGTLSAGGQTKPPSRRRTTIGVALEGGGALGLAHIGVLQWFEQHHIPIDYLAGTSMGGLVGGLYASGKSPQQLQDLVKAQNWDVILGGATPYEDLSFRRKEDKVAFPNSILLGLRKGLSLPGGLNAGQWISLLIDRETLPYSGVRSFDDLPIPFRCVATDLVSGKQAVFKDGSLSTAMRATMAIPGLFSPVREAEHVYVDGGLVGNMPTDVVREMGADLVIGVHLETSPGEADKIQSLFSILGRSIDVVVAENEIRGLANADLVVKVGLQEFSSLDYVKADAIIQKGIEAATQKSRLLETFALDDTAWAAYLEARKSHLRSNVAVPQFVRVEGANPEARENLERLLQSEVGKPIDKDRLEGLLSRLTGTGRYDTAGYQVTQQDGEVGLLITVHEKVYAPPILQLGFEVDGSESNDVDFTLATRLTLLDVAGYRSEWRTDLIFGNTYGIESELYRPFSPASKWFFAPHASASNSNFKVYRKNDPLAEYRFYRAEIGGDIGYGFSRFSEVRLGYEVGTLDARLRLGTAEFASLSGRTGATQLRYRMDHTDDPVIPRRGLSMESNFHWYDSSPGETHSFPVLDTRVGYFHPITKPASLFLIGEGGTTFGSTQNSYPQFFLGGSSRLSAYGTNELFGDQYYFFRTGYLHDLLTLPPLAGRKIYAIGSFELGKMYGFPAASRFPSDFAAGILAETAVGPLLLGASVGESGHRKWFFQLGRVF